MRVMVYVNRKCKQQRTSACSPATSKKERDGQDISRKQRDPTLQTVGCCELDGHLRGWAPVESAD